MRHAKLFRWLAIIAGAFLIAFLLDGLAVLGGWAILTLGAVAGFMVNFEDDK